MRTLFVSAVVVAVLTGSAHAQSAGADATEAGASNASAACDQGSVGPGADAATLSSSADAIAAVAAFPPPVPDMTLTFDDEFNTASISDDNFANGTNWSDHLWFTDPRPELFSVANGVVSITADQNPATNADGFVGQMATVNEKGKGFAQRFGYFEASIKVPGGKGTWPSFYVVNNDRLTVDPDILESEIDVMEAPGVLVDTYLATLHADSFFYNKDDVTNAADNRVPTGDDLSQDFHRYGMLWDPNSPTIDWYFDGQKVLTSQKFSTTDGSPMMVVLGSSVGDFGLGGNDVDPSTPNPAVMRVDWVHVYQFNQLLASMALAATPAGSCP